MLIDVYAREYANLVAGPWTSTAMDTYIQLIYAGNAVYFPSSVLKGHIFVASNDVVSGFFGKYFEFAKGWFGSRMGMTSVEGGHGFNANYATDVSARIAQDLIARARSESQ